LQNLLFFKEFIESISSFLDANSFKTGMYESVRNLQKKYPNMNYSSNMLFEIVYLQPQISDKFPKKQNICILWNARANNDKFDNKLPSFLQIFMDENVFSFEFLIFNNKFLYLKKKNTYLLKLYFFYFIY